MSGSRDDIEYQAFKNLLMELDKPYSKINTDIVLESFGAINFDNFQKFLDRALEEDKKAMASRPPQPSILTFDQFKNLAKYLQENNFGNPRLLDLVKNGNEAVKASIGMDISTQKIARRGKISPTNFFAHPPREEKTRVDSSSQKQENIDPEKIVKAKKDFEKTEAMSMDDLLKELSEGPDKRGSTPNKHR